MHYVSGDKWDGLVSQRVMYKLIITFRTVGHHSLLPCSAVLYASSFRIPADV
jgi:hypothetical protein